MMTPEEKQQIEMLTRRVADLELRHERHRHTQTDRTRKLPFLSEGRPLGTTESSGFIFIPTCAGAPTGVPTVNGAMIYDTTNNNLYVYNAAWKKVLLA